MKIATLEDESGKLLDVDVHKENGFFFVEIGGIDSMLGEHESVKEAIAAVDSAYKGWNLIWEED